MIMKNKLLKSILLGAILAFFWHSSNAQTLIISEVADPGDNWEGRFVELYNATDSTIDLDANSYYLSRQSNGGSTWGDIQLTGTIGSGEVYIIGYSSFESIYGFAPDVSSSNINGNGDDGYFLYSGGDHTSGTLEDAYGVIDTDGSGEAWEYENSRAVRNENTGNSNNTWTASEWTISSADVSDMTPGMHISDYPVNPVFVNSTPYVEKITESRFDLVAALHKVGSVYYKLVNDGVAAPTITEIKNADTLNITSPYTNFSARSKDTLSTNTPYDLYVVAEDTAGNTQSDSTLIEFTTSQTRSLTLDNPTGGETFYSGDTINIQWTQSNINYVSIKAYDPIQGMWFHPDDAYKKVDATLGSAKLPTPEDLQTNSNYRITIQDWADMSLADSSDAFTIEDTIAPSLAYTKPMDDASKAAASNTLMLGLDEEIAKGSGNVTLYKASDDSEVEAVDVTSGSVSLTDSIATIELNNALDYGTSYYVNVAATAFEDLSGNTYEGIDDKTTWNFTTDTLVTISEIQDTTGTGSEASPYAGNTVLTSGIVVDTVSDAYYIQEGKGAWKGIKVMAGSGNIPNPGDEIRIKADVNENYGYTRLQNVASTMTMSTGNSTVADTVSTKTAAQEKYEGVAVFIEEAVCTNPDAGYGQWEIDDGSGSILVDDNYYAYSATQDAKYNIFGFGHYSYGDRKILPTEEADIELLYTGPTIADVNTDPNAPTSSDDVFVYANVNDANHSLDTVFLAYGMTSGNMTDTLGMLPTKQAYKNTTAIPAQSDEATVYYSITAINTNDDTTMTSEMSYSVHDPASTTLPYSELFSSGLGKLYTYSVSGDSKEWYYDSDGYAAANGYYSGDTEEDWLVIPAVDFTQYSNNIKLSFSTWYNYGEDNSNNFLKLKYSTDYSGTGDPSNATWTEISFTKPSSSQSWQSTGEIDLPDTSSTNVYLAFQYHYEPDYYRQWEIDSLNIYDADKPVIKNYAINPAIPVVNEQVEINAEVTDAAGVDTVYAAWGKSSNSYQDTIGMSHDTLNSYISDSKIPGQTEGTDIYYRIVAENVNTAKSETPEQSYTVVAYPELTISEIQYTTASSGDSPEKGNTVITQGIVTGYDNYGYYIQDGKGSWNGIYVYDESNEPYVGDKVKITGAVDEYFGKTELKDLKEFEVLSSDNDVPDVDTIDTPTANTEAYEGVLARVEDVTYVRDTVLGDDRTYPIMYNDESNSSILMDSDIYDYSIDSLKPYNIQGVIDFARDKFMVLPRNEDDIEFAGNVLPEITNVVIDPENPSADQQVQINATITDGNPEDNITATLSYGTSQDNLSETTEFTNQGTGSETEYAGIIPGQPAGTTVYFEIEASDSDTTSSVKEGQYQVAEDANAIINNEALTFEVYPNPSNGQFSIEIDSEVDNTYRVAVFNTVGKMVYQKEFESHSVKQTINLTDQNDGIYFLKVTGKNAEKVIKLIKE
jgi:predicted extracellular nuclease